MSGPLQFHGDPTCPVSVYPPYPPTGRQRKGLPQISPMSYSNPQGYNPCMTWYPDRSREQFDPHPEVSPVSYAFFSAENVAKLQRMCQEHGLGTPRPNSLLPFMMQALQFDRGVYNAACVPNILETTNEQVDALNHRVLLNIRPIMQATKFGFEQYYRDINQMRRIPDHPVLEPGNYSARSQTMVHPYYYSLD